MDKTEILITAEQETAFFKAGILGFSGSGKTHTAMPISLGLIDRMESKKPLAFLDTETGSDFWIPRCKAKGINILRAKSRAFQDLLAVVGEAEKNCDVLIIDSISHVWKNFLEGYMKRLNRTRLQFQDWNVIKPEWGRFTDLYLNSKLHIILCGRAGWEYDHYTDEETGKKELFKTGTKMKAETEMGYEPSLLLEMERVRAEDGTIGGKITHRCHVIKDRADMIDGQHFDNPTFACFLPVIETLNFGGRHLGIDTSRSSEEVFDAEGRTEQARKEQTRKVLLEEIEGILVRHFPSTSGADKKAKLERLEEVFGTTSWTRISALPIEELRKGIEHLRAMMEPKEEEPQEATERVGVDEPHEAELPDPPGGKEIGRDFHPDPTDPEGLTKLMSEAEGIDYWKAKISKGLKQMGKKTQKQEDQFYQACVYHMFPDNHRLLKDWVEKDYKEADSLMNQMANGILKITIGVKSGQPKFVEARPGAVC